MRPQQTVDVMNLALDHLGQEAISLPTDKPNGPVLLRQVDLIREKLLREYIFKWSQKRIVLTRTRTPEFDYSDAYALPNDYIRLLTLGGPVTTTGTPPAQAQLAVTYIRNYDIEMNPNGGVEILCNNSGNATLAGRYIYDATDLSTMDACFINAWALHLALNCCYQITKSTSRQADLNKLLEVEIPLMQAISSQETPITVIQDSKFLKARRMGMLGQPGSAGPWTVFGTTWD